MSARHSQNCATLPSHPASGRGTIPHRSPPHVLLQNPRARDCAGKLDSVLLKRGQNEWIRFAGIIALVLYLKSAAFVLVASSILSACSFRYDPAAAVQYYRAQGWALPGISDALNPDAQNVYPLPAVWTRVPGAVPELLEHEYPYILEFPAQGFALNGARKKMRRLVTKATIVRWQVGDRIVAYSYNLIPLEAKRKKGKWVVQHEMGCIFPATFIDDRGDGVFRILVQRDLTPDLLPAWAKQNPI